MEQVNSNCKLRLLIGEAKFLKDADTFGKQDPFMQFKYDGKEIRTTVKDDAGKHAIFNEEFILENMEKAVKGNQSLVLESFDKDPTGVDWLGEIKPIAFAELI